MSKSAFNIKKTPFFWAYFVAGALLLTLGIFLLPIWEDASVFWKDWGRAAVNLIMFAAIVLYIFLFLVRQFRKERRESVKMLVIVEIVIFAVIALGLILEQFALISVGGPCAILGMALWIRGVISVIKGYLYKHTSEERRYSVAELAIAIALITFGTVLVVKPLFTELDLIWICSVAVIILAVVTLLCGILAMPQSKKTGKTKK